MLLSLAVLLVAGVATAGDMAWFDMENCSMCKNISGNTALMENMTWEQHGISNGIVSITMVSEKYIDDYRKAHTKMAETGMKLQGGEMMALCGSCTALGMCLMKGVEQEYVETSSGDVWIVTSENAEVVAELQSWAKRNKEEMKKMQAKG
jgi:hypothetical protein